VLGSKERKKNGNKKQLDMWKERKKERDGFANL